MKSIHKRSVRRVRRRGFSDERVSPPKPCAKMASNTGPKKCIRPGKDNEDRNRALNPHYKGQDANKFKFRLDSGPHKIYDDALRPRNGDILKSYVAINYGVREKKGAETYVYAFAVQLRPESDNKHVSGWIKISAFKPQEQAYLLSKQFRICASGPKPRNAKCTFKVTGRNKPASAYLERKVAPFDLPPKPRRKPRPKDTKKVREKLKAQERKRARALNDYRRHRKAGDYFEQDGHVNVLVSLPGHGGKSRGTPPLGTAFCKSTERRKVYFYKRNTKKRTGQFMWFVRGYYQTSFGHTVTGWIAEKALWPQQ